MLYITNRNYYDINMNKSDKTIPSGSFRGKKIGFASTYRIDMFIEIAEDFIKKIFYFDPEEYLITDEFNLYGNL